LIREALKSSYRDTEGFDEAVLTEQRLLPPLIPYMEYANFVSGDCQLFATAEGFIGLAPTTMREGNVIVLVHGSKFPMILRHHGDVCRFRGFAYVHGIWHNELDTLWKDRDVSYLREHVLV
jgi:hypothetical protein